MGEIARNRNHARGAKQQSSPQQASNGLPNDIDDYHGGERQPRENCYPINLTSLEFCLLAFYDMMTVLGCAMSIVGAGVRAPNLAPNRMQRRKAPMGFIRQSIVIFMTIGRELCFTIIAFIMAIVRKLGLTIPGFQRLLKCFRDASSSGFTRRAFAGYTVECSIRSSGSSDAGQTSLGNRVPTLTTPSKNGINNPGRDQVCVTKDESGLVHPGGCDTIPALSRETMILQPNTMSGAHSGEHSLATVGTPLLDTLSDIAYIRTVLGLATQTNGIKMNKLNLADPGLIDLFEPAKIRDSTEYLTATSVDGCGLCHQSTPLLVGPNVTTATRWECPIPRRLSRMKRSKYQSCFASFPPQCRAVYSMTGISSGPGGDGNTIAAFEFRTFGTPSDQGVPPSAELKPPVGDPSSQRLHVPGLDNDWPHISQGRYEPESKPTNASPPLASLSTGTQRNEHKFGWNAGFVAGCMFATRASGPAPGAPQSQSDPIGPTVQFPPVPIPVDRQPKEHEPEWYAGFVAGCEFASRTSGGPPSGMFRPQSDSPEPTRRVLSSTSTSTPSARSPAASSNDAPLIQLETDSRNTITPSPHHETSQRSGVELGDGHRHDQLVPSITQAASGVDTSNVVQVDVVSVSQGSQFGLNSDSFISFDAGRMHLHDTDKKRHKCEVCNKVFRKKYQLSDHMHRHRGDVKGHPCDIPGCNKSFTNRANMRRHQKTHAHPRTAEVDVKSSLLTQPNLE